MSDFIFCNVCQKNITKQNYPRHRYTRLHNLNVKLSEVEAKVNDKGTTC